MLCVRGVWRLGQTSQAFKIRRLHPPPPATISPPKTEAVPNWRKWDRYYFENTYGNKYASWRKYKNIDERMIKKYSLRAGVLPLSSCHHERLLVPLFNDKGKLTVIRGRAIHCDCGKWMTPKHNKPLQIPLPNSDEIKQGSVVIICENVIDGYMVKQYEKRAFNLIEDHLDKRTLDTMMRSISPLVGVATQSVSYWANAWLEPLKMASKVIVAYDHGLAGNGGGIHRQRLLRERRDRLDRQDIPDINPNGPKLANLLRDSGIDAVCLDWGKRPAGSDIGSYLI